jgi:hypothetical protein
MNRFEFHKVAAGLPEADQVVAHLVASVASADLVALQVEDLPVESRAVALLNKMNDADAAVGLPVVAGQAVEADMVESTSIH